MARLDRSSVLVDAGIEVIILALIGDVGVLMIVDGVFFMFVVVFGFDLDTYLLVLLFG